MNKNIKVMGSVILSAVLAQSMLPLHVYALEDENPTQKTETVYAVLNADGSISDTIVSSWLHDDDGIHNIKETLDETVLEAVPGREPSPEEEFLRREETDRLAEWIMDLPENYREALYLFCVEGRSYQETALEMGRSVPQVKIWIYRARKKLQKRRMEER